MDRVAVFIDWQNCYNWARRAFHQEGDPSRFGQLNPLGLAQMLADKGSTRREVTHIGVYRGRPDPRKDNRTYSAHMRHLCGVGPSVRRPSDPSNAGTPLSALLAGSGDGS